MEEELVRERMSWCPVHCTYTYLRAIDCLLHDEAQIVTGARNANFKRHG